MIDLYKEAEFLEAMANSFEQGFPNELKSTILALRRVASRIREYLEDDNNNS